jgi:flagellar biosynthesis protein FlhG
MVRTPPRGAVILIASGKGGVGKTNLAVNLGIQLMRRGTRTVLFDADFGHANAEILLDITPRADAAAARDPTRPVAELLSEGPAGVRVLCGISTLEYGHRLRYLSPMGCARTVDRLQDVGDVVLVDCGARLPGPVASFALACHELLLVTTPEPTAITDTYALLKLLQQRGFCAHSGVVVNMARRPSEARQAARRLQRAAARFLGLSLESLGLIPFDRHVAAAVQQRIPFVVRYPRCAASRSLDALARRLGHPGRNAGPQPGMWRRVASLFF